ncbi:hypothetical protein Aperf_G00000106809 [Anoplocephala perfoliata]
MSRLHDLVVDLGIEVDKFATQIEKEKRRIAETKARFDQQLKQRYEAEKECSDLEMELERLKSCFVESAPPSDAVALCLTKAHGEVRAAAQRMRDERMAILDEYQAKLDRCEMLFRRNSLIEEFIDAWRKSLKEGKNIPELPQLIRKLSEDLAQFYSSPVHQLLEGAVKETNCGNDDSTMDVSASLVNRAEMGESLLPPSVPLKMQPLNVAAHLPDDTLCNASNAGDMSIFRIRGGFEPSIHSTTDFSQLDGLDNTLTGEPGICSEEELRKLMNAKNEMSVDLDPML